MFEDETRRIVLVALNPNIPPENLPDPDQHNPLFDLLLRKVGPGQHIALIPVMPGDQSAHLPQTFQGKLPALVFPDQLLQFPLINDPAALKPEQPDKKLFPFFNLSLFRDHPFGRGYLLVRPQIPFFLFQTLFHHTRFGALRRPGLGV